jgi:glycosyltransferase involved in cell wall biosynthesis
MIPEKTQRLEIVKDFIELSIIMPCLNESETLATCINKAQKYLELHHVAGEIIIADNGSSDGSQAIATANGARVVHIPEKGYGSALMGGIAAAKGTYIIMGDADDSYDFSDLSRFLEKLREGYELVMGNRFRGGIEKGAMPPLHRYLGNPVLTGLGRLFFGGPIKDFHCGLRGFCKQSIINLNLHASGMEFASEMVVKATLNKLKITEIPTTLSPDGRSRPPHLRSWRDGWRHLRFLLIYCPKWLFFIPGMTFMLLGIIIITALVSGPKTIFGVSFDIHTMLYAAFFVDVGLQTVFFSLFSKVFALNSGLLPKEAKFTLLIEKFTLEKGIILGIFITLLGLTGSIIAIINWESTSFGVLIPSSMMRLVIPSLTLIVVGIQFIFSSFFLSILNIKTIKTIKIDSLNN